MNILTSQFEPDGEGFVYRAGGRGAPVPVTRAEYVGFRRQLAIGFALHCAGFMLCVVAAAMLVSMFYPRGNEIGGFILMAVLLIAIGYALWRSLDWALHAPARALAGRAAIGRAYGREEARARAATLRKATFKDTTAERIRPGGCALMILLAVIEIAVFILAFGIASRGLPHWLPAIGLPGNGGVAGVLTIALPALPAVAIDRLSVRWTGGSIGRLLAELPSF